MERSLTLRRWGRVALAGVVLVVGLLVIMEVRGADAGRPASCGGCRTLGSTDGLVEVCASVYIANTVQSENGWVNDERPEPGDHDRLSAGTH